ncbi:hypothetical protein [Limnoraphis robusta]|nr:hypothetical protein [Limnoraphis robusta]
MIQSKKSGGNKVFTPEGELVPTPEESAKIEKKQREAVEQQLEL